MAKAIKKPNNFDPDQMPEWIASFWKKRKYRNIVAGINDDDCAVISIGSEEIVISVDYLNSNPIAIEMGIGTYKDLGKLLVAANISDLCGTGAKPIAFLASIMLNKRTANKEVFKLLMNGIKEELLNCDIPLVGGDTKLGNSDSLCGIVLGMKEKGTKLFLKNGAKPGDLIWVSGQIGSVAAAIDGLKNADMSKSWEKWAKEKIVNPILPLAKSRKIAKTNNINGGTDLSDGLGADLLSLCKSSKVGAVIDAGIIPVASQVKEVAKKRNVEAWRYAFTIGGDFQFIVTANPKVKLERFGFWKIGHICKERKLSLMVDGTSHNLPITGHSDFEIVDFRHEVDFLINNIKLKS